MILVAYSGFLPLSTKLGSQNLSQIRLQALKVILTVYPVVVTTWSIFTHHTDTKTSKTKNHTHHANQVEHFQCTYISSSADLSWPLFTHDSYKHWKPTACPHCCQTLSPLPLHQSSMPQIQKSNIAYTRALFLPSWWLPDAGHPWWCLFLWITCCKSFSKDIFWGCNSYPVLGNYGSH